MTATGPAGATGDVPSEAGVPADTRGATPRGALRTQQIAGGEPAQHMVRGWALAAAITIAVLGFSVLTVFRYTSPRLQADSILQSVMSVQDVRLFYWGQDRLASVVPFLASPVADPMTNLFLVLLINATAIHVLLLLVARMGTLVVTGSRRWSGTLVLFLLVSAVMHGIVEPMFTFALDAQPYAMSWALALGAFLMWKRHQWWALTLSVAMVGVAVGLNPSVILVAAFAAALEMFRRRQWVRWFVFGAMWIAWLAISLKLSHAFAGDPGPRPDPAQSYFDFNGTTLRSGATESIRKIAGAFDRTWIVVLVVIAGIATWLLNSERRAALTPRLLLIAVFCGLYWMVIAGNPWVAANGFHVRYFFPLVLAVVVAIAAPISAALLTVRLPAGSNASRTAVAVGVAALAAVASVWGPLTPPSRAPIILATKATADYARDSNAIFVAGYYWLLWPVLLQTLDEGRTAVHGAGARSDGDLAAYGAALDRALEAQQGPPRAICVGDEVANCTTYLEYLTRPGWRQVEGNCPMPSFPGSRLSPPAHRCTVLEYRP